MLERTHIDYVHVTCRDEHWHTPWKFIAQTFFCFRREDVRKLIEQYFTQLTEGCGNKACTNKDCATGSGHLMSPTDAATSALAFATSHSKGTSKLCSQYDKHESPPSSDPPTNITSHFLQKLTHINSKQNEKFSVSVTNVYPSSSQVTRWTLSVANHCNIVYYESWENG